MPLARPIRSKGKRGFNGPGDAAQQSNQLSPFLFWVLSTSTDTNPSSPVKTAIF